MYINGPKMEAALKRQMTERNAVFVFIKAVSLLGNPKEEAQSVCRDLSLRAAALLEIVPER
jgi:hypothetical protein